METFGSKPLALAGGRPNAPAFMTGRTVPLHPLPPPTSPRFPSPLPRHATTSPPSPPRRVITYRLFPIRPSESALDRRAWSAQNSPAQPVRRYCPSQASPGHTDSPNPTIPYLCDLPKHPVPFDLPTPIWPCQAVPTCPDFPCPSDLPPLAATNLPDYPIQTQPVPSDCPTQPHPRLDNPTSHAMSARPATDYPHQHGTHRTYRLTRPRLTVPFDKFVPSPERARTSRPHPARRTFTDRLRPVQPDYPTSSLPCPDD